ncbi:RNA polymerase sigma factor RpoE [Saccharospirillum sp. MSK14-1]|uniref:RNA polymerase sigma factor RpoE n=1 Tax=Saccharospirillum sp. MSK14-1 TaxID=1897632 RepID=UPI000D39B5E2|nr:RNA polymerase sigma factor RpoE [Saccharospirillum sp. MSK14-1]PTY38925.1 RNA polymerase sigma factor RpoE [Saccharospirillum sp. MSK14-1]
MAERQDADQILVDKARKGDKRAFDLLVLKYQHRVATVITRYLRDQDAVADIVQEAFIKAYRALPNFRGDSAFYSWLYRIAINCANSHLDVSRRRPSQDGLDIDVLVSADELADLATPERLLVREQMEQRLQSTLNGLPEDLRVAVTLREFEGLSYEDIARIMDTPVGTVRSRIFRAREAIEVALDVPVGVTKGRARPTDSARG